MFNILAPLLTASSIKSEIYFGFPGSGNGVSNVFSHGRPSFNSSTALVNLSRNSSLISSCTYNIFKAVHLCPLNDKVPEIHSLTVKSISASFKIIPGFLASNPNTKRNLLF